jgi:hypothetical protein
MSGVRKHLDTIENAFGIGLLAAIGGSLIRSRA